MRPTIPFPPRSAIPVTLLAALLLPLAAPGCRFGNSVERKAPQAEDPVEGYYETAPQQVVLAVHRPALNPDTGAMEPRTFAAPVPLDQIIGLLRNSITNPVALVVIDKQTREGALINPTLKGSYLPVFALTDGRLDFTGGSSPSPLWASPDCGDQLGFYLSGNANVGAGPLVTGSTLPLRGRISMTATLIESFLGTCPSSLQAIADCYADEAACASCGPNCPWGSTSANPDPSPAQIRASVQNTFRPYLDAGLLQLSDLAQTQWIATEVQYQ